MKCFKRATMKPFCPLGCASNGRNSFIVGERKCLPMSRNFGENAYSEIFANTCIVHSKRKRVIARICKNFGVAPSAVILPELNISTNPRLPTF